MLILGHKYESVWENIGSCKIWESNDQKKLRVSIDLNLKFSHYIFKKCKKAGRNLSALTRICEIHFERRIVLMKYFIESQFAYCPLVWMCCDRTSDKRMNLLQERGHRMVYNDMVSTFETLLEKNNSGTIHVRNPRILATELYKTKENLDAPITHEIFEQRNIQYNLSSQTDFQLGSLKTVKGTVKGTQTSWSKTMKHSFDRKLRDF